MLLFIVLLCLMEFTKISHQQEQRIGFLQFGNFICEGKDAGNYTSVNPFSLASGCVSDAETTINVKLIACLPDGQKSVNTFQPLAYSGYPAGAYYQSETLYLITSGNLMGKYAYLKQTGLQINYGKGCSSILGLSFTYTISRILLIAEELKLEMFLNPDGGFNPFKKIATTVCQGQAYIV